MLLNPMGLTSGVKTPNHQQAGTQNPVANPAITVQPHAASAPSGNPMALTSPLPIYTEKLSDKDDPAGTIRAGKSGKGSQG
jgi:hypothetical protein